MMPSQSSDAGPAAVAELVYPPTTKVVESSSAPTAIVSRRRAEVRCAAMVACEFVSMHAVPESSTGAVAGDRCPLHRATALRS